MFKQKECQNKKGDKILCKEGKEAKIRKQKRQRSGETENEPLTQFLN